MNSFFNFRVSGEASEAETNGGVGLGGGEAKGAEDVRGFGDAGGAGRAGGGGEVGLEAAASRRRFLTIVLPLHRLGSSLHFRVGRKRVAFGHFSYSPPPNHACDFQRKRFSSVSFHLSFFLDDVKYRFDFFALRMSLCLCA